MSDILTELNADQIALDKRDERRARTIMFVFAVAVAFSLAGFIALAHSAFSAAIYEAATFKSPL